MGENVKEIARQIMANAFGKPIHEGVDAIARAILAERKRCAEVAREYGRAVGALDRTAGRTAQFIAEAIEP